MFSPPFSRFPALIIGFPSPVLPSSPYFLLTSFLHLLNPLLLSSSLYSLCFSFIWSFCYFYIHPLLLSFSSPFISSIPPKPHLPLIFIFLTSHTCISVLFYSFFPSFHYYTSLRSLFFSFPHSLFLSTHIHRPTPSDLPSLLPTHTLSLSLSLSLTLIGPSLKSPAGASENNFTRLNER